MPYAYANFGDLKAALGQLLSDVNSVFWTDTEKGILINAALREWNALSRMFRDRGSFNTVASQVFYNLPDVLENGNAELFLAPTVSEAMLLQQGKYMLMEPNPDDNTTFTDGITALDFSEGFADKRSQFLLETGLIITEVDQVTNAGRVTLANDAIVDLRRVSWLTQAGALQALFREDGFVANVFDPLWTTRTGTPRRYSLYPDPLLTLQLLPPPNDTGTLKLQVILATSTLLDDYTPAVLWGVLADICNGPGPGSDPFRAAYCEQRYGEYVIVGQQAQTVMQAYLGGNPVPTNSVFDLDTFHPTWTTPGVPKRLGSLGANLVAVAPVASSEHSVIIDSVRNAPRLVAETDSVPLGREYVEILLNYCLHLASFKQGGEDFQKTFVYYDEFVKAALAYNNRMNSQNIYFETLVDRSLREEKQQPLREEVVAGG